MSCFRWPNVIKIEFSHKNLELFDINGHVEFLNHHWKALWFAKFIRRKFMGNFYMDSNLSNFSLSDIGDVSLKKDICFMVK